MVSRVTSRLPVPVRRAAYRLGFPLATAWWLLAWVLGGSHVRGAKCILTSGGEVLMVRHTYGDRRRWDLPGGLIGRGEDAGAAGARELHEELGLVDVPLRDAGVVDVNVLGRRDRVHLLAGETASRSVRPDRAEIAEVAWFSVADLPAAIEPGIRAAIEAAAHASHVEAQAR
jgi:8-oxo-dGTP pyrophosphatase MutT (NUDIX family)